MMLFLALKKVQIVKINPRQIPITKKYFRYNKIYNCSRELLNTNLVKTWIAHLSSRGFLEKND